MKDELVGLLEFDGLHEAEQFTGKSIHEDESTVSLGMLLNISCNKKKEQVLQERGDVHWGMPLSEYLLTLKRFGFREVLHIPFKKKYDVGVLEDHFFVLWHEKGILLKFDTYFGNDINGGSFFYNVEILNGDAKLFYSAAPISSGGLTQDKKVFTGYHDCREAVLHTIQRFELFGTFLKTWVETPFILLIHHGDRINNENFKVSSKRMMELTKQRMLMLPEEVQKAINVPKFIEEHCNEEERPV